MSEKTLLSPSLRVENGDYHGQAAEVMRSLIGFYDSMIKLGPFMKISNTKLDKLEKRAKLARDNLRKFLDLVPARNDKQELHILTYKKRLTEHCHLQHTLEVWKSALRNFSSLPQVPAEMLEFPSTYGPQPVTQMIDKILTDCALPFDLQHLREEMVELEVLKPYSIITRESCRLFFDSLSDKSVMLQLENYNKTMAKKSTSVGIEKNSHVNEPSDNSYMYIYPPGFTPSAATKAFLEEQVSAPKKTYVLPPDIFEKRKKVLPDIRDDLQKQMERLTAHNPTSHGESEKKTNEVDIATAPVKRGTSRIIIDRYDEYLKIKKIMQGLIGPADKFVAKTAFTDTAEKQTIEDHSPQASELSDTSSRSLTTQVCDTTFKIESEFYTVIEQSDMKNLPLPGAVKDKNHKAQKGHRSKSFGEIVSIAEKRKGRAKSGKKDRYKHSYRTKEQRNQKRNRDSNDDGKDTNTEEPAFKRAKAFPVKLPFLEPASIPDFKIPKCKVKTGKCLRIPKVGLKRKRQDDIETDRCGKRYRNH